MAYFANLTQLKIELQHKSQNNAIHSYIFNCSQKPVYTHTSTVFVDEMSFKSAATMCSNTLEKLCAHAETRDEVTIFGVRIWGILTSFDELNNFRMIVIRDQVSVDLKKIKK